MYTTMYFAVGLLQIGQRPSVLPGLSQAPSVDACGDGTWNLLRRNECIVSNTPETVILTSSSADLVCTDCRKKKKTCNQPQPPGRIPFRRSLCPWAPQSRQLPNEAGSESSTPALGRLRDRDWRSNPLLLRELGPPSDPSVWRRSTLTARGLASSSLAHQPVAMPTNLGRSLPIPERGGAEDLLQGQSGF